MAEGTNSSDFKELLSFSPSSEEYSAFLRLGTDPDFLIWKRAVERFQVRRALNLISGSDTPQDIKNPLDYYRGGHDLWIKALRVVENADGMLRELERKTGDEENK